MQRDIRRRRRRWKWWKLSPIPVAVGLIVMAFALPEQAVSDLTGYIWLTVAACSLYFAEYMRRWSKGQRKEAQESYPEDEDLAEMTDFNYDFAIFTVCIHVIFVAVGILVVTKLNAYPVFQILSRDGILVGQYLLMLKIGRMWAVHRRLQRKWFEATAIDSKA